MDHQTQTVQPPQGFAGQPVRPTPSTTHVPPTMQVQRESGITITEDSFLPTSTEQAEQVATSALQQEAVGSAAKQVAQEMVAQTGQSATSTKRTRAKRTKTQGTGSTQSTSSAPAPADSTLPPDQRSVNILLPLATYEWFEKQAREAEYEPTLAKYLQWKLRQMEKEQRREQAAEQEAANRVGQMSAGLAGLVGGLGSVAGIAQERDKMYKLEAQPAVTITNNSDSVDYVDERMIKGRFGESV